jgi:hypothetical protein
MKIVGTGAPYPVINMGLKIPESYHARNPFRTFEIEV